jgi:glycosyltransferase involved in cell wall biosynthesis
MKELLTARASILCVDQFSNLGGGQRSLLDLLPALSAQGWRPTVAIPAAEGPFTKLVQGLGYRTHHFVSGAYALKKKTLLQHLRYACELPGLVEFLTELVEGNAIDLMYVNGPRLVPPAAWVAWRTGIPLVFHCHNRLLQSSAIALTGQALELASAHVIACCQYAAEPLREYVQPDRLRVIYNGVTQAATRASRSARKIKNIGVVGRIEPDKGQLQFLHAARIVSRAAPECRFTIVGSTMFSGANYYNKVVAAGAGLAVDFRDWNDNIEDIYSDLDLLVVPSSSAEATTRVIMEAYAAGVPVVAFPVGGIPEVLADEETGFLADAVTVDALAQRIISVLRMQRTNLARIVRNAKDNWRRRFTLDVYRESVCDVLSEAMWPTLRDSYDVLPARAELSVD